MDVKHCKYCEFAKDMGYQQIMCKKRHEWQPELYSCEWWKANVILERIFAGDIAGAISHYCNTHHCEEKEAQQAIKKIIGSL